MCSAIAQASSSMTSLQSPAPILRRLSCTWKGSRRFRSPTTGACSSASMRHGASSAPADWQFDAHGARTALPCQYVLVSSDTFSFRVLGRVPDQPLMIDPIVQWATFLGGTASEAGGVVRVAPNGDVVLSAVTLSYDYPVTPGAFDVSLNDSMWGRWCRDSVEQGRREPGLLDDVRRIGIDGAGLAELLSDESIVSRNDHVHGLPRDSGRVRYDLQQRADHFRHDRGQAFS